MTAKRREFSYYPGCFAGESAREYDASIHGLAKMLDVGLEEIDDWNCCGWTSVADCIPEAAKALARRNARLAPEGRTIVSGCPNCVAGLQDVSAEGRAVHVLGLFTVPAIRRRIVDAIADSGEKRPVGSLKVACYYGCELQNPELWGTPDGRPEDPMEDLMTICGATVIKWRGRRRPTGGNLVLAKPELGFELIAKILEDFEQTSADVIVTACPHSHFSLDSFQHQIGRRRRRALSVPILHFTEVLALALGIERVDRWLERHVTSPLPLLDRLVNEEEATQRSEKKS